LRYWFIEFPKPFISIRLLFLWQLDGCDPTHLFWYFLLKSFLFFFFVVTALHSLLWWYFIRNDRSPSIHSNLGSVIDVWLYVRGRSEFTIAPMMDAIVARFSRSFPHTLPTQQYFRSWVTFWFRFTVLAQITLTEYSFVYSAPRNFFSRLLSFYFNFDGIVEND